FLDLVVETDRLIGPMMSELKDLVQQARGLIGHAAGDLSTSFQGLSESAKAEQQLVMRLIAKDEETGQDQLINIDDFLVANS
ncbi:MAG: hypothetical protein N2557_08490, partial [Hydrogenophilus sp.]|nr:hypothetical protein [Hydrogenophilus sp.]